MTCFGYAGSSWGYNFDWQARAFYVPVGKQNIVTTVFAANAFLNYVEAKGMEHGVIIKKRRGISRPCCRGV
jgi:hypothetical protein